VDYVASDHVRMIYHAGSVTALDKRIGCHRETAQSFMSVKITLRQLQELNYRSQPLLF